MAESRYERAKAARRPMLALEAAAKDYGDLVALHPCDLTVPSGQSVALVGHNGSGKSTLLRLAAGLLDVSGGSVLISGEPAGSLAARATTSFVPDEPVLYDDLSVREHLEYVSAIHGAPATPEEVDELVERLGLHGAGRRPAGPVQPWPAAEGRARRRPGPAVRAAAGRRAVRRPRRRRQGRAAGAARRGLGPGRHPRGGHPRPELRRAGRPLHRPARRPRGPRRPRHPRRRHRPRRRLALVSARNDRTSALNWSGCSRLHTWPAPGSTTSVEPAIASCIASATGIGARTSSPP